MTRQEIEPEKLSDATVVVIDVFLATTTLLTSLENGARSVLPVASLEEAEEVSEALDPSRTLRGGEQDAEKIEGYDLGPYPEEYAPEVVDGKDVIFVTTNGTRAIASAAPAKKLLLGCLRNALAVARHLEESGTESVYVVCAGSAGRFTMEDLLGASAILSRLNGDGYLDDWRLNDAAWLALDFAERYEGNEQEALKRGRAGRWFLENDMAEEFEFVGDVGASETVVEVVDGKLRPVSPTSHQQDADGER
ncbi:MAG: 2-phosphosulfolactate phosphatase [Actinobacteria bacterium]|nr:2-phosphosulfolactate phosphatase [Actinomycetota bacterium]